MSKLFQLWCCNRKLMIVAGFAAVGVLAVFSGSLTGLLPFLLLAACPLSCLLMAVLMGKGMQRRMKPSQQEPSLTQTLREAEPRLVDQGAGASRRQR